MTDEQTIILGLIEFFKENKIRPMHAISAMKSIITDFTDFNNEAQILDPICFGIVKDNTDYGDNND